MNKPFYSRRRLKRMGVVIKDNNHELEMLITSNGGSIIQSQNIIKMIKSTDKPIRINMDSMISSVASWICSDINKTMNKWI